MIELAFSKRRRGFCLDVSLKAGPEVVVLFGPSGSGKTTLLECIAGLAKPDKGTIKVAGRTYFSSRADNLVNLPVFRRRVGYVFQNYALFPHLTVRDNVGYGIRGRKDASETVDRLIDIMRLKGLENRFPSNISGGQQQRVALARAMAVAPEVLLLDEPFSALDQRVREKLVTDLVRLHREYSLPVIHVTHNLSEALSLGDKIAILNEGRIEQFGPAEEVYQRPATRNVARFLGVLNIFDGVVSEVRPAREIRVESRKFSLHIPFLSRGSVPGCPPKISSGGKVSFFVRPENIEVLGPEEESRMGGYSNVFHGQVRRILARDGVCRLLFGFTADEYDFVIDVPRNKFEKLAIREGTELMARIPEDRVYFLGDYSPVPGEEDVHAHA